MVLEIRIMEFMADAARGISMTADESWTSQSRGINRIHRGYFSMGLVDTQVRQVAFFS